MAKFKFFFLIALFLISGITNAQVTIAPTNLFIEDNTRFGTYLVINGSNETQEIAIEFFFGYSTANEEGLRNIVVDDTTMAANHSVSQYVRAFPQNFTLAPGQRQVVRLRINAPQTLEDGTYWSRIKTSSVPETPPLELQNTENVSASVSIRVEQITGLYFKKGDVSTGIEINDITTSVEEENDKIVILANLDRTGNSPFLGSITTTITDQNGEVVRRGFVSTTIYFSTVFRQELELGDLAKGQYTVSMQFESSRTDVSENEIVQMPTERNSTSFSYQ